MALRFALCSAAWLVLAAPLTTGQTADSEEGCSCLWRGSFAEVAGDTDLVVLGQVTQVRGNAVDLSLEQTLLGETYREDIRVWMQARDYCRPSAETFPPGSRWVMAIERIERVPEGGFDPLTPNISYGRLHDYELSSCGGYFLRANGDTVTGNLTPGTTRWVYEPDINPVLIDLVQAYLQGEVPVSSLVEASEQDPAVRNLILDTRRFLRGQEDWVEDESEDGDS